MSKKNKKRKARQTMGTTTGTTMGTTTGTTTLYNCHIGNSVIYYNDDTEAGLAIGGWNKSAIYDSNTFVIDLTGDEDKYGMTPKAYGKLAEKMMKHIKNSHAGWLSLPFPDMKTPSNITTYEQWHGIAMSIKEIIESGTNVLVACLGGHGRSGLFCAIVGYILNHGYEDWENPVEQIRKIHCSEAVETEAQENFVYRVLGLDFTADASYYSSFSNVDFDYWNSRHDSFKKCPFCKTNSMYIDSNGFCLSCQKLAEKSMVITDITTDMLAMVQCTCDNPNCLGTWKAAKCGHVVHDKLVVDGWCEKCYEQNEHAEKIIKEQKPVESSCEMCGTKSPHAFWTGMCWTCHQTWTDEAPDLHDTLTDAYPVLNHKCESIETCNGIVKPDVCGHVVHNRYVIDGLCPECQNKKHLQESAKFANK